MDHVCVLHVPSEHIFRKTITKHLVFCKSALLVTDSVLYKFHHSSSSAFHRNVAMEIVNLRQLYPNWSMPAFRIISYLRLVLYFRTSNSFNVTTATKKQTKHHSLHDDAYKKVTSLLRLLFVINCSDFTLQPKHSKSMNLWKCNKSLRIVHFIT